jgi:hypothetical protein
VNSSQASWALDDPCLDALHARLVVETAATAVRRINCGTWVNYGEVPPEGLAVEHGDVIHIGPDWLPVQLRCGCRKPIIVAVR